MRNPNGDSEMKTSSQDENSSLKISTLTPEEISEGYKKMSMLAFSGTVNLTIFLNDGYSPNGIKNCNPLCSAVMGEQLGAMALLLHAGADPNAPVEDLSPLSLTTNRFFLKGMKMLLEKGADIEHGGADLAESPLLRLAATSAYGEEIKKKEDCLKFLLENGANPNARDCEGETALSLICKNGISSDVDWEMSMRVLLKNGTDPNAVDKSGHTALTYAAWRGHLGKMKLLLENGANPNGGGIPPLIHTKGGREAIKLLLAAGADPDLRPTSGPERLSARDDYRKEQAGGDGRRMAELEAAEMELSSQAPVSKRISKRL